MKASYLEDAGHFFCESEHEMDPDSAIFILFHRDPAFWLWMAGHFTFLVSLAEVYKVDKDARPMIDRFLHGIICADQFLGSKGTVLRTMIDVLSCSQPMLNMVVKEPDFEGESLLSHVGPHSCLTSIRFVHYAQSVLSATDYLKFKLTFGLDSAALSSIMFSAALAGQDEAFIDLVQMASLSDEIKRSGLVMGILNSLTQSTLLNQLPLTVSSAFLPPRVSDLCGSDGLSWPEWQLMPLLEGGKAHADELGVNLAQACKSDPLNIPPNNIWHLFFDNNHLGASEDFRDYLLDDVIPARSVDEIIGEIVNRGTWRTSPRTKPWACNYLLGHKADFYAMKVDEQYKFESLILMGIDKKVVMNHPDFGQKLKARILSDELGC